MVAVGVLPRMMSKCNPITDDDCSWVWEDNSLVKALQLFSTTTGTDGTLAHRLLRRSYCVQKDEFAAAYFYLTFTDTLKQKYNDFLRSIVSQFCQYRPKILEELYYKNKSAKPSDESLNSALSSIIRESSHTFIIIDALDKSPMGDERDRLLKLIKEMHRWSIDNLHILATSRKEPDIEHTMLLSLKSPAVCIEVSQNTADIDLYVRNQLNSHRSLKTLGAPLKNEMEDTLVSKSNGM
jgi:hypothetical protein